MTSIKANKGSRLSAFNSSLHPTAPIRLRLRDVMRETLTEAAAAVTAREVRFGPTTVTVTGIRLNAHLNLKLKITHFSSSGEDNLVLWEEMSLLP